MSSVEDVLSRLADVRRSGDGWTSLCPAHEDHKASLSIARGADGRTLLHCHAGCETGRVCYAIGLRLVDLRPGREGVITETPNFDISRRGFGDGDRPRGRGFVTAREAVGYLERLLGRRSGIWTYQNDSGDPVGVIARWDLSTGKEIRPVSLHGSRWMIGAMPAPRPLYRLPDLVDAMRVYVCEGEKAADATQSIGLISTTSAHGSNSARKTDWEPLAGKECILLPDNDEAGWKYAETVEEILSILRPAPVIKFVELPDLPPGGDMADYLAIQSEC